MAVPKVDGQFIAEAIKYIDENGVPWHNTSTKYELVWENGNTYPPKYVIAVANHLQNGAEIERSFSPFFPAGGRSWCQCSAFPPAGGPSSRPSPGFPHG